MLYGFIASAKKVAIFSVWYACIAVVVAQYWRRCCVGEIFEQALFAYL
jgi:hypothetical protein